MAASWQRATPQGPLPAAPGHQSSHSCTVYFFGSAIRKRRDSLVTKACGSRAQAQ